MAHAPSSPACTNPLAVVQSMTFWLRSSLVNLCAVQRYEGAYCYLKQTHRYSHCWTCLQSWMVGLSEIEVHRYALTWHKSTLLYTYDFNYHNSRWQQQSEIWVQLELYRMILQCKNMYIKRIGILLQLFFTFRHTLNGLDILWIPSNMAIVE